MTTQAPEAAELARAIASELAGNLDERVAAQVTEQVEARVQELGLADAMSEVRGLREQLAKRPPQQGGGGADGVNRLLSAIDPRRHNPSAIGAQLDGRFTSFGDFLKAVAIKGAGGGRDPRLAFITESGEVRADLSGQELATGGALVPEEFRADLLMVALQEAVVRRFATAIPMGSARIRIPAVRDTSHASNVFGGITASWTKSGASITESEPTFKQVGLDALGLKFYTEIENELLSDSFTSVEGLLARMFGMAIPWFEEKSFIGGTGAGEPLGVRNADAKVQITRATADTIVLSDLADMYSRMLPGSLGRAVWMCAPSAMEQILQIESAQGATAFLTRNLGDGPPMAILGRPLFVNEHMPALADPDTIMFIDWSYYLIGDRQALSIATSPHFRFQNDITAVRGVERLDGRPWVESAITPAQGSTTLSPFVGIGT